MCSWPRLDSTLSSRAFWWVPTSSTEALRRAGSALDPIPTRLPRRIAKRSGALSSRKAGTRISAGECRRNGRPSPASCARNRSIGLRSSDCSRHSDSGPTRASGWGRACCSTGSRR
ncbi:transposase [Haematobacter missouriensis]|nr:transposase [Haematobacter missouriensis]